MKLWLAWEAIQDLFTTYSNIAAYTKGLKQFCSFGEKNYIIKIQNNHIQAYYDDEESEEAANKGLQDFLSEKWIQEFISRTNSSIKAAKIFVEKHHEIINSYNKSKLFETAKEATKIIDNLFTSFQACQPQYTSKVREYVLSKIKHITDAEHLIDVLTLSEEPNCLQIEEIEWNKLKSKISNSNKINLLEQHRKRYGMINAADGLEPWTLDYLEKRLEENQESLTEEKWLQKRKEIIQNKKEILSKYDVPDEVIKICQNIWIMGNLRLALRAEGWMPISQIIPKQIFPELAKYLEYTPKELGDLTHKEFFSILKGDKKISKEELKNRHEFVLFGILNGEEVLWSGDEAKKKFAEFAPKIDKENAQLKGQSGMKGYVKGKCYVFNWNSKTLADDINNMPDKAILVAGQTRPQLMPAIKKASAIITDEGGLLSHAAIISRELKIPSIISTRYATHILKTGDYVEVDADKGIVRIIK